MHTHTQREELRVGGKRKEKVFNILIVVGITEDPCIIYIHRFCANDKLKIVCASVGWRDWHCMDH